jgi:enoyl-CoA hydratase/carnithine racemase
MIKTRKQSPSATIILDNRETHNALSRSTIAELIEVLGDLHREQSVRAVILTHSGATFCSGVNLREWHEIAKESDSLELWQEVASELQELVETMLRFPKPIIAALDGSVYGAGLGLLLACDLVVASPRSTFQSLAPKHGLISGVVGPLLAFRCCGGTAARILIGGEPLTAEEAYRVGLVHHVVSSELTWAKAHEMATNIASGASEAIQMTKRLINEMIGETLMVHLSSGAAAMATACSTSAAVEGLAAFVEKRPPKFP